MPANVDPVFVAAPVIGIAHLSAANTGADLSSNAGLLVTGAANGTLVSDVRVKYLPGTNVVATAARLYVNNGGTLSTVANNALIDEVTVAAITSSQVAMTAIYSFQLPVGGLFLPSGYKVYCTIGTYSTGTLIFTAFGGTY